MADKRKVNLTRRLSVIKNKWYGIERFECANADVVSVMDELNGSEWETESLPGICICNRIDTDFDFESVDGWSHVVARFSPPDIIPGYRPRRARYAELLVYPAGTYTKQKQTSQGITIEGWDSKNEEILGYHRWVPNYDNKEPDQMHLVVVRTAIETNLFTNSNEIINSRGAINKTAMNLSWFNAGEETMLSLGCHMRSDFDDDSLTSLDYKWLYDQRGWNSNKSTRSYVNISLFRPMFNVTLNGEELEIEKKTGHKVPATTQIGGYRCSGWNTEKVKDVELKPFRLDTFESFQGYTWW